jgi:hypothetical protein
MIIDLSFLFYHLGLIPNQYSLVLPVFELCITGIIEQYDI